MTAAASPPIVEYLDDYLHRRRRSGVPLVPGEAVTLAVGLLRGCRRAEDRAQESAWALTARGCPVLIDEIDGDDALGVTAAALAHLAEMVDDEGGGLVARARDTVLTQPPRAWEEAERRLFAWAEPVPLVLGPLAPRVDDDDEAPRSSPQRQSVLPGIDGDLAAVVSGAVGDLRGKWRSWRHARAFSFGLVAAGVATVLGVALPTPAPAPAPSSEVRPSSSAPGGDRTPDATPPAVQDPSDRPTLLDPGGQTPLLTGESPAASPTGGSSGDGAIVDAARALLTAYAACAGEPSCEQNLREGRADPGEARPVDPADARISLVDDFGGLAVVRLERGDDQQYLTLVREKDRWLVRAVRTVADQPS